LPRDLPADHQLAFLRAELVDWLVSCRPGKYDESGQWVEFGDTEPVPTLGFRIVTARALGTIEPEVDEVPILDHLGCMRRDENDRVMHYPSRWEPLPEAIPGVEVELQRTPDVVPATVRLTEEQVAGLDHVDLDPRETYFLTGQLLRADEARGVWGTPLLVQEARFLIPQDWLCGLDEVEGWTSQAEWTADVNQLTQEARPED
jgi:hypothetical protein